TCSPRWVSVPASSWPVWSSRRKRPVHSSRDRPDGMSSFGAGRVRWRPAHGLPGRPGAATGTAARAPPGSPTLGEIVMQHAVRPRTLLRPGPTPAPRPRTPRGRSLIDADALRVLHRAARVLLDDLPQLTDRLVAALQEREPAYRSATDGDATATWQEAHRSLRYSITSLLDPRGARDAARRCSWRIGATRAEQGLPLDALLHAFRLGGSLVWQGLVDETSRTAPEDV